MSMTKLMYDTIINISTKQKYFTNPSHQVAIIALQLSNFIWEYLMFAISEMWINYYSYNKALSDAEQRSIHLCCVVNTPKGYES